nr:hypothetical protein [Bacillota bacterium]
MIFSSGSSEKIYYIFYKYYKYFWVVSAPAGGRNKKNGYTAPSRFAVPWRERVGIEPTGDATRLPLGFEDRGGHQHPIRSHISRMVIRFSA